MTETRDERPARIGLRIISSAGWQGGVNYVANWARACATMPGHRRPRVWLLPFDDRGHEIAQDLAPFAEGVHPFAQASTLDLDMVFPATQIFESPFDAPWAGWIPDWQCQHLPELFDRVEIARRALHYGLLATRAPFLVLSSRMAIDDSTRLFGERLVPHRQLPFPAVLDPREVAASRVDTRNLVQGRYFLVANQWWKHKNHDVVLRALSLLDDPSIRVVCTGALKDHRWPGYPADLLDGLSADVAARLTVLGSVDRNVQLSLMLGCEAIIQPSLFEGWSTVVEEARALGIPLLLSATPVHLEQAPPGATYFDPNDARALADAMMQRWEAPTSTETRGPHGDVAAFREHCVERLVDIAFATRQNYRRDRHDPARLLAELTVGVASRGGDEASTIVAGKALSGTRTMLATNAHALERYREFVSALGPRTIAKTLEDAVVVPAHQKLTAKPTRKDLR